MVQFYLVDESITSDVTSKEVSVAGTGSQPRKGLSSFCIVSEITDSILLVKEHHFLSQ